MKVTRRDDRLQAFGYIKRWKEARPEEVTKHQWTQVIALLYLIARHYPRCYLSQETMAEKLGWSVRGVRSYVATAKRLGVIQVTPDAGTKRRGGHSWTNLYHINPVEVKRHELLVEGADMRQTLPVAHEANFASKGTVGRPSLPFPQEAPTETELRSVSFVAGPRPPGPVPTKVPAKKARVEDDEPVPYGARPPKPKKAKPRADEAKARADAAGYIQGRAARYWGIDSDPDQARRLRRYFLNAWEEFGVADVRVSESTKEVTGYIRSTFLSPAAGRKYTPDEVKVFIDEFMQLVYKQHLRMKPGQSAWRRFTGWWGRRPVQIDRTTDRERQAEEDRRRYTA